MLVSKQSKQERLQCPKQLESLCRHCTITGVRNVKQVSFKPGPEDCCGRCGSDKIWQTVPDKFYFFCICCYDLKWGYPTGDPAVCGSRSPIRPIVLGQTRELAVFCMCLFIVLLYFLLFAFSGFSFCNVFTFSTLILLTCKTASQITYTVLMETLNPAQSTIT